MCAGFNSAPAALPGACQGAVSAPAAWRLRRTTHPSLRRTSRAPPPAAAKRRRGTARRRSIFTGGRRLRVRAPTRYPTLNPQLSAAPPTADPPRRRERTEGTDAASLVADALSLTLLFPSAQRPAQSQAQRRSRRPWLRRCALERHRCGCRLARRSQRRSWLTSLWAVAQATRWLCGARPFDSPNSCSLFVPLHAFVSWEPAPLSPLRRYRRGCPARQPPSQPRG